MYDSNEADEWIDKNYDCELLVSLQKQDIGGPLACMLSFAATALTIFGTISSDLIVAADQLAQFSGFPVIIRPRDEDPCNYSRYVVIFSGFTSTSECGSQ